MEEVYDVNEITRVLKSRENLTAFTGFSIPDEPEAREGVLKIASFYRPDGSGYLTLTFIMDASENPAAREPLEGRFGLLTEETLRPFLGEILETVFRCPLDALSNSGLWRFEEINVYLKSLKGIERRLIEHQLMPALKQALPFQFDRMEWWEPVSPGSRVIRSDPGAGSPVRPSLGDIFRQWIRSF